VKETLDDRFSRHVEALFKKTIHYILTLIVIGFKQIKRPSSVMPCCPLPLNAYSSSA